MKHYINNILILLVGGFLGVSCSINDPVDDIASIGRVVPTAYWEQLPTSVKSGQDISFELQYFPTQGKSIKDLSVWYSLYSTTTTSVSCPIVKSFKYTIQEEVTNLEREFIPLSSFIHSEDLWSAERKTYFLKGSFPTTNTLSPIEWIDVEEYDEAKFNSLFSKEFGLRFQDSIYSKLQVADFENIFTVTNPNTKNVTKENFHLYIDTIDNQVSGRKDLIVDPDSVARFKEFFYSIPLDSLFFDDGTGMFKLEYTKTYSVGARFKVTDSEGMSNLSEEKKVGLR